MANSLPARVNIFTKSMFLSGWLNLVFIENVDTSDCTYTSRTETFNHYNLPYEQAISALDIADEILPDESYSVVLRDSDKIIMTKVKVNGKLTRVSGNEPLLEHLNKMGG